VEAFNSWQGMRLTGNKKIAGCDLVPSVMLLVLVAPSSSRDTADDAVAKVKPARGRASQQPPASTPAPPAPPPRLPRTASIVDFADLVDLAPRAASASPPTTRLFDEFLASLDAGLPEYDPYLAADAASLSRTHFGLLIGGGFARDDILQMRKIEDDGDRTCYQLNVFVRRELERRQALAVAGSPPAPLPLLSFQSRRQQHIPLALALMYSSELELKDVSTQLSKAPKALSSTSTAAQPSTSARVHTAHEKVVKILRAGGIKSLVLATQEALKKECKRRGIEVTSQAAVDAGIKSGKGKGGQKKPAAAPASATPEVTAAAEEAAALAAKELLEEESEPRPKADSKRPKSKKSELPRPKPDEEERAVGAPAAAASEGAAPCTSSATSDAARAGGAPPAAAASGAAAAHGAPPLVASTGGPPSARVDAVAMVFRALDPTARSPLWRSERFHELLAVALAVGVEQGFRTAVDRAQYLSTLTYVPGAGVELNGAGASREGVRSLRVAAEIALAHAAATEAAPAPGYALIPGVAVREDVLRLLDAAATPPLHTQTLDKKVCVGAIDALEWCSPDSLRLGLTPAPQRVHVLAVGVRVDKAQPQPDAAPGDAVPGAVGDGHLQQVALLGLACSHVEGTYTDAGRCYGDRDVEVSAW
jgi:hypothetical protein